MGYAHGKNTKITVDGSEVKAKTSAINRTRKDHDTTGYGDDDETASGGTKGGTFTMGGVYDKTATTGNIAVLRAAWENADNDDGELEIVRYPEGDSAGKPTETFSTVMTGLNESNPVDGMVAWDASFKISGAVVPGTVGA